MKIKTKIGIFAGLVLLAPVAASAQNLVAPKSSNWRSADKGEIKTVYVGNASNHYFLYCHTKAPHCVTPEENKNYLLFNSNTRWKMPGGKVPDYAGRAPGLDRQVQPGRERRPLCRRTIMATSACSPGPSWRRLRAEHHHVRGRIVYGTR